MKYGFKQNADNPLMITAVVIPSFSSDNVTISTAVFSFSMSSSVVTSPAIEVVPTSGAFLNHTGSWAVQKITPQVYASVGFNEADLMGNNVYQVVLQNAPELNNVVQDQEIPLFSFELPNDCQTGKIEVLTNDGVLKDAIFNSLRANFNNQISVSVDDLASKDIYDEKDAFSGEIECPLLLVNNDQIEFVETSLELQPNPAASYTRVVFQSDRSGNGMIVLHDTQYREVLRQELFFVVGENNFPLNLENLPAGTYMLKAQVGDLSLQKKIIKVKT